MVRKTFREPTVPRTPPFNGTKQGRGSGNRRFPELPDNVAYVSSSYFFR